MGFLGDIFGGKQKSSGHTNVTTDQTSSVKPFTGNMLNEYNNYLDSTTQNYNNQVNNANSLNQQLSTYLKKGVGDTSYFKQAWNQAQGIDQSNSKNMNSRSLNPYDDEVMRNYIDASNKAAYLANGQNVNQMMQNMIGSGMANGSGHQTAAAKVGAQLAANINAQNQQAYLARQNKLEENALKANNQLGNFYTTLSNIGIDYAKLSQQDLQTLLSAYQATSGMMNDALKSRGQAIELGKNSETTTHTHKEGTEAQTQSNPSNGLGDLFSVAGAAAKVFGW